MMWVILVIAVVLAVGWVSRLDDPWRDLTRNQASTEAAAVEPDLRPLSAPVSADALADHVVRWAARQPNWQVQSYSHTLDGVGLQLVRTTRWMRFRDDVSVTIHDDPETGNAVLIAESRSRIGKGDLGQNPRNIKELIGGLRQELARSRAG